MAMFALGSQSIWVSKTPDAVLAFLKSMVSLVYSAGVSESVPSSFIR